MKDKYYSRVFFFPSLHLRFLRIPWNHQNCQKIENVRSFTFSRTQALYLIVKESIPMLKWSLTSRLFSNVLKATQSCANLIKERTVSYIWNNSVAPTNSTAIGHLLLHLPTELLMWINSALLLKSCAQQGYCFQTNFPYRNRKQNRLLIRTLLVQLPSIFEDWEPSQ